MVNKNEPKPAPVQKRRNDTINGKTVDLPEFKPPKHEPCEYRNAARIIDDLLKDCGLGTYGNAGGPYG